MITYSQVVQLLKSLIVAIGLLSVFTTVIAQDDGVISLSGEIRLDAGLAEQDYSVDVTVYNHSIVILVFPSFAILRPVLSSVTRRFIIPAGSDSVMYSLDGISTNAVDYRIRFDCANCGAVFPTQYFTPTGNVFRVNNDVYINPDDFPNQLNFELESATSITGRLISNDGRPAYKNFLYLLRVTRVLEPNLTQGSALITIVEGASEAPFQFEGLKRTVDGSDFILNLDCINCRSQNSIAEAFLPIVPSNVDSSGVEFSFEFERPVVLPFLPYLISD